MANTPPTGAMPVRPVPVVGAATGHSGSHMDWSAIFAGAVVAVAISIVMLTFGSGIGLSIVSAEPGSGASATVALVAAAIWFVWVQVSGFLAGGYVAGRLRARLPDATPHEVEVRDVAHGVVVWAVGVAIAATIAAAGVVSGVQAFGATAAATAQAADDIGAASYVVDRALRPVEAGPAASPETREEVVRIVVSAAAIGELPAADRAYLIEVVGRTPGVTADEAEARVTAAEAWARDSEQAVRDAAEAARIASLMIAFLTAATLVVGAGAAALAAQAGGRHRDDNLILPYLSLR